MRKVTAEERELFLAALSGRLPVRTVRAAIKAVAKKAAEQAPSKAKPTIVNGKRQASDDEVLLFLEAIGLRPRPAIIPAAPKAPPPKPHPKLAAKPTGLDGATKKKLEKGEIAPAAKLDLHGMTEAAAHGTLITFLTAAHRRGDRLVLIVTGKGEAGRGVLKQMVPRWLDEAPMAKLIADKRWAHKRHGGEGALYVYLRKPARG
ncbi:Smr/MutS family protein [Rhizomicrobium electricum]|uniref:Smr domain-containing protein n=1 Tax=Rhizomicrobium electricum TaxID=480070 RepID=A0ABN1F2G3_9PROT|nr:Smr/MutS family protein [Rhizomicrobium electricum]NIJ49214.1 DNA-nicking Smr family endonuclease [Rhizomicrobium electricum]